MDVMGDAEEGLDNEEADHYDADDGVVAVQLVVWLVSLYP